MLRLLLWHATAAAFPMLGAEIPLGERTKMSWDAPQNGDDGVDHFQLFLPRRWSKINVGRCSFSCTARGTACGT